MFKIVFLISIGVIVLVVVGSLLFVRSLIDYEDEDDQSEENANLAKELLKTNLRRRK